ncbi:hypothetical protein LCGC14_1005120 [marine sediment metagenome]|uniref:Flavin reductase like domain-containing protein n=1 Tax=marine sediment metagenome TaxID=412755 RepID=A0A0F9QK65_9ZZZZ|nr:flavin reductase [Actinomycetota bacterium]
MEEQRLKDIMANINSELVIVTTRLEEKINGQAVAWFTQASMNPTMVAIGLASDTYTNSLITKSNIFAVNFVPAGRSDLIEFFGYNSGRDIDKFADFEYDVLSSGNPLLKDSAAFLDCTVVREINLGDHDFFVGEVIDGGYTSLKWLETKDFKPEAA